MSFWTGGMFISQAFVYLPLVSIAGLFGKRTKPFWQPGMMLPEAVAALFIDLPKKNRKKFFSFLVLKFVFLYLSKRACEVTLRLNTHTMNVF